MCGRYALYGPRSRHRDEFGATFSILDRLPPEVWNPYNIAPSTCVPVVLAQSDGSRVVDLARWGFQPAWVGDDSKLGHPINAKLETAPEKRLFRAAFRSSRVLVPASGFYEWLSTAAGKQPFFFRHRDEDRDFGLGGIVTRTGSDAGATLTLAILTTVPNAAVAPVHDRMPVIVRPEHYQAWLDPSLSDADLVRELGSDFPADQMTSYPVSKAVGSPRARGVELVTPTPESGSNGDLFAQ
ncbi:hypothetical protein dqs_0639 [Azoarcus olearius]|uniref:SOS response-associated peptidase n=1 Tax=Azoarcus sp. (strain BH72) TaxID=418699 RepID=UPI00080627F6|nr:SOS response-associated peptidase [Azoarcus olearius]ANQ83715.1 hypothetical protein dqs_0639 [Azoarcus olearius]